MLGKSAWTGVVHRLSISLCMLLTMSCANTISQDKATGADGKQKGAKPVTLENGEGKAKGIVTYPGGDRVDWKLVELPDKMIGNLDIELKWKPPRPKLQLAFEVFDEWNTPIITSGKGKKTSYVRTASVENAKGKYYIRVYAKGRGDAGKYTLTVDFHESANNIDWTKVDVPEPPKLAAVPADVDPCDDTNFDPKKPECRNYCPANPPPNWGPCKGKCPDPPDPTKQECWDKVCPTPATTDSKKCMSDPKKYFPPCPDVMNPDPANPNCPKHRPPVTSRVVDISVQGSETMITISIGSDKGITTDWSGTLLKGDGDTPADNGSITIVRVTKSQTLGKVRLTPDQVKANLRVKLTPPGK